MQDNTIKLYNIVFQAIDSAYKRLAICRHIALNYLRRIFQLHDVLAKDLSTL
jgi:hypothetical protein